MKTLKFALGIFTSKKLGAALWLAVIFAAFQNCSQVQFGASSDKKSAGSSSGASPTDLGSEQTGILVLGLNYITIDAQTVTEANPMKIMLVVDDSYTMTQSQARLATGVQGLLNNLKNHNVDLHVYSTTGEYSSAINVGSAGDVPVNPHLPVSELSTQSNLSKDRPEGGYIFRHRNVFYEYFCMLAGSFVRGADCRDNPTVNNRMWMRAFLGTPVVGVGQQTSEPDRDGGSIVAPYRLRSRLTEAQKSQLASTISNDIKNIGVNGSTEEQGLFVQALSIGPYRPLFKSGDRVGFIVISDENDSSAGALLQADTGYQMQSYPGHVAYNLPYRECTFSFKYIYQDIRDGVLVGAETNETGGVISRDRPASCSGACGALDTASASQRSGYVASSCRYEKPRMPGSDGLEDRARAYIDRDAAATGRDLCSTSFIAEGTATTYANAIAWASSETQYTQYGAITQCTRNVVNGYSGVSPNYNVNRVPLDKVSPTAQASGVKLDDSAIGSTSKSMANWFVERADAVLGRANYSYTSIILDPSDATCSPQSGQSYGTAYKEAATNVGANGQVISLCNSDYGAGFNALSSTLSNIVVDTYSIALKAGQKVRYVRLVRGSVQRDLFSPGEYTISNGAIHFSSGLLKLGDMIHVYID